MQNGTSFETECGRGATHWQVRRGLTAVAMAAVMVAVLAFALAVGAAPAQAGLLPGIPC